MGYVCPDCIGPNFNRAYGACGHGPEGWRQLSLPEPTTRLVKVPAAQLVAGDVTAGSGQKILRLVRAGIFQRNADDTTSNRPWPTGKVEVLLQDKQGQTRVAYWNARTSITVYRTS